MTTQIFPSLRARCCRFVFPALIVSALVGCQAADSHATPSAQPVAVVAPGAPMYLLTGGVEHPGPRPLLGGQTISAAIRANLSAIKSPGPMTVVFIRRGPEGKVRKLLDVDKTGALVDPLQDQTLRDGDELLLPLPPGVESPPIDKTSRGSAG